MATPFLTFSLPHRAWYGDAQVDLREGRELMFAAREDNEDGRFLYEFAVREHRAIHSVRVEVFSDAWDAFTDFPDLFAFLASMGEPDFDSVVEAIAEVYHDVTPYERG